MALRLNLDLFVVLRLLHEDVNSLLLSKSTSTKTKDVICKNGFLDKTRDPPPPA